MKKFPLLLILFLAASASDAQCEFPFNSGTRQFTDAILYNGTISLNRQPDGSLIYSVDPTKLSLKKNESFPTRLLLSSTGKWYFKWNYSTAPNRWRPMTNGCNQSEVRILYDSTVFPNGGRIEVDFFYLDPVGKVSAGFMGSVSARILP